ncbi:MAG: DUF6036 family nucleotidyltransferase [Actinomycetota bacterium]
MRGLTTSERIAAFMAELGKRARVSTNAYFTGGVTAVLFGWRDSTIDIDLKLIPDSDELLRELPHVKESLGINVEFASPDDFIPELPGWRERSVFIAQHGLVSFLHYDPYAQALSKIERGHRQDVEDVRSMLGSKLVDPGRLLDLYTRIEDSLHRYPAIDAASFRAAVLRAVG